MWAVSAVALRGCGRGACGLVVMVAVLVGGLCGMTVVIMSGVVAGAEEEVWVCEEGRTPVGAWLPLGGKKEEVCGRVLVEPACGKPPV